jgi:hypothetical protein
MVAHAQEHHRRGYALPVRWMGIADTFRAHVLKTVRSLQDPGWYGLWRLSDQDHQARFVVQDQALVALDLFGVEDPGAMDRVRMETTGVWAEEPAPSALMVTSSGLSESAWLLALTSQRVPSYHHPAIMTLNYPDEDHWTWQRFVGQPHPGTATVRVPPGERASAAQRAEWAQALQARPDLVRRLLDGEPGIVQLGVSVATGFRRALHVSPTRLTLTPGEPVWMAHDGGLTPATVIGQYLNGRMRIVASLTSEHAGMRQHVESCVIPWLARAAPWLLERGGRELLYARYDPSLETGDLGDIDSSPLRVLRSQLPGHYVAGPVSWAGRRDPMLAAFNVARAGEPALQLDPVDALPLIRALDGRWYYPQATDGRARRELPAKPNHPWEDLGDAFAYLLAGMAPTRPHSEQMRGSRTYQARTAFNPLGYQRGDAKPAGWAVLAR